MRKTLAAVALTYSVATFGQFSRSDLMVSGTFLMNSELMPNSTTGYSAKTINTISIRPAIGFFLNKYFEFGGQAGYSLINRQERVPLLKLDFKTTQFLAAAYGQRYFRLSRKFNFTIFTSITFSLGIDKNATKFVIPSNLFTQSSTIFQFSALVRPTLIFFPKPKLGIQGGLGSIGYLYSKNLRKDETQHVTSLNHELFSIGVTYILNKDNRYPSASR